MQTTIIRYSQHVRLIRPSSACALQGTRQQVVCSTSSATTPIQRHFSTFPFLKQRSALDGYYADILSAIDTRRVESVVKTETGTPSVVKTASSPQSDDQDAPSDLISTPPRPSDVHSTLPQTDLSGLPNASLPPKPTEPENCCMSGCAHCVWDQYREDLEAWSVTVQNAKAGGHGFADSHAINAGSMPVEMSEFMRFEEELKRRRLERERTDAAFVEGG